MGEARRKRRAAEKAAALLASLGETPERCDNCGCAAWESDDGLKSCSAASGVTCSRCCQCLDRGSKPD